MTFLKVCSHIPAFEFKIVPKKNLFELNSQACRQISNKKLFIFKYLKCSNIKKKKLERLSITK